MGVPLGELVGGLLQLGHGDEAVETSNCHASILGRLLSFNWATAMKPWRQYRVQSELSVVDTLQLGHGDEAVETDSSARIRQGLQNTASIGPRR